MTDGSGDSNGSDVGETPLTGFWKELLEDAEAIAAEYREDGWDVETLRPGDISRVRNDERVGLSVLVPDDEYETVETLVERERTSFDAAEVYRRAVGDVVFAIAVERDEATETAVVVPLYYRPREAGEVLEAALEEGQLRLHLRPPSVENWVTFGHDEPSLFVPDRVDWSDEGEGDANGLEDSGGPDADENVDD